MSANPVLWTPIPFTISPEMIRQANGDISRSSTFGGLLNDLGNITDKYVDRGKDVLANAETRQKLFDQQYKDQVAIRTGAWINQHPELYNQYREAAFSGDKARYNKALAEVYASGLPVEVIGSLDANLGREFTSGQTADKTLAETNRLQAAARLADAQAINIPQELQVRRDELAQRIKSDRDRYAIERDKTKFEREKWEAGKSGRAVQDAQNQSTLDKTEFTRIWNSSGEIRSGANQYWFNNPNSTDVEFSNWMKATFGEKYPVIRNMSPEDLNSVYRTTIESNRTPESKIAQNAVLGYRTAIDKHVDSARQNYDPTVRNEGDFVDVGQQIFNVGTGKNDPTKSRVFNTNAASFYTATGKLLKRLNIKDTPVNRQIAIFALANSLKTEGEGIAGTITQKVNNALEGNSSQLNSLLEVSLSEAEKNFPILLQRYREQQPVYDVMFRAGTGLLSKESMDTFTSYAKRLADISNSSINDERVVNAAIANYLLPRINNGPAKNLSPYLRNQVINLHRSLLTGQPIERLNLLSAPSDTSPMSSNLSPSDALDALPSFIRQINEAKTRVDELDKRIQNSTSKAERDTLTVEKDRANIEYSNLIAHNRSMTQTVTTSIRNNPTFFEQVLNQYQHNPSFEKRAEFLDMLQKGYQSSNKGSRSQMDKVLGSVINNIQADIDRVNNIIITKRANITSREKSNDYIRKLEAERQGYMKLMKDIRNIKN